MSNNNNKDFLEQLTGKKMTLGNLLWSIRECEEMTQTEFAKKIGVSRQYLCDVEHGRRIVSPKAAATIAIKLGDSVAQFVRLALQDELNKYNIPLDVQVIEHRNAA